jgi:hypothetical protein
VNVLSLLLTLVVIVLALWLCVALVVLRLAHTNGIGTASRDDSNSAARS